MIQKAQFQKRNGLNEEKKRLVKVTNKNNEVGDIHQIIKNKDVFIGVSRGNLIDENDIKI